MSCAKSDKNDLKEAQMCLNNSTPSTARSCLDKISSDSSAQAYKLRCAGIFISEGFNTPSSFITALDQINNSSGGCTGGCSSTITAVSSLTFKNNDNTSSTDRARSNSIADEAFNACSLSGTSIYLQISSLFKIGTYAANIAYQANGGATPTADQIKTAISSISDSDMGAIASTTYASSCSNLTTASDATKKYCAELGAAVNSGNSQAAVGACLKAKLADPNHVCP